MLIIERSYRDVMSSEQVTGNKSEYARLLGVRAEQAGLWVTTTPTHLSKSRHEFVWVLFPMITYGNVSVRERGLRMSRFTCSLAGNFLG